MAIISKLSQLLLHIWTTVINSIPKAKELCQGESSILSLGPVIHLTINQSVYPSVFLSVLNVEVFIQALLIAHVFVITC